MCRQVRHGPRRDLAPGLGRQPPHGHGPPLGQRLTPARRFHCGWRKSLAGLGVDVVQMILEKKGDCMGMLPWFW